MLIHAALVRPSVAAAIGGTHGGCAVQVKPQHERPCGSQLLGYCLVTQLSRECLHRSEQRPPDAHAAPDLLGSPALAKQQSNSHSSQYCMLPRQNQQNVQQAGMKRRLQDSCRIIRAPCLAAAARSCRLCWGCRPQLGRQRRRRHRHLRCCRLLCPAVQRAGCWRGGGHPRREQNSRRSQQHGVGFGPAAGCHAAQVAPPDAG